MATASQIATYIVRPAAKEFKVGEHLRVLCKWVLPLTDQAFSKLISKKDLEICYTNCVDQIDVLIAAAFKRRGLFAHGISGAQPFASGAFAVTFEELSFKTERIEDWRDIVRRYNVFDNESAYTSYLICRGI